MKRVGVELILFLSFWMSAHFFMCANDWGHSPMYVCAMESAGVALGIRFLVQAFASWEASITNGQGFSEVTIRRMRFWLTLAGFAAILFVGPATACLLDPGVMSFPIGGSRALGCFVAPTALSLIFLPFVLWIAFDER